jgi:GxxExxY protein
MNENEIAQQIVDAAFKIHSTIGPGLLEAAYQAVMVYELHKRGLRVEAEKQVPVNYEEVHLDIGFRADLIVEDKVIVELKSVELIAPVHKKQLLTYLRLADKRLGLLINFGAPLIKDGITRVANHLDESQATGMPVIK